MIIYITYGKNKIVPMSIQKSMDKKKIESDFDFGFVGQCFIQANYNQHAEYPER